MRFKPVPDPPTDLESVGPILAAVPRRAGAVDDCCGHLVAETRLEAREEAETWLTFLRALELAIEADDGYRRSTESTPEDAFDRESLRRAFRNRVYGAETVLEILEEADEPASVTDVFDAFRAEVPAFDRERESGRLEAVWTERVRRLLEWGVLLDLVERTADGRYRRSATLEKS